MVERSNAYTLHISKPADRLNLDLYRYAYCVYPTLFPPATSGPKTDSIMTATQSRPSLAVVNMRGVDGDGEWRCYSDNHHALWKQKFFSPRHAH